MPAINLTDKVQSRLNDDKLHADIFGVYKGVFNDVIIDGVVYAVPYRVSQRIKELEKLLLLADVIGIYK